MSTYRSSLRFYLGIVFCLSLSAQASPLIGQTSLSRRQTTDQIWLEPKRPSSTESDWHPRGIQKVIGEIVELDVTRLRYVVQGDEAESVAATHRVLWIQPSEVDDLEAKAIQQYAGGEYSESLSMLPAILKQRPPVWRQQWLTMMAANAAWKSGRSKIALELVSQLDRRPLPPITTAWLPIAWQNGAQQSSTVDAAKSRLDDPSATVQLVAASWLLTSTERSNAITVLKRLRKGKKQDAAWLAGAVLWRTATPPQVIELHKAWQNTIDAMPMVLQVGPTITLIEKLRSAGLKDLADHRQWSMELTPIHPHPSFCTMWCD